MASWLFAAAVLAVCAEVSAAPASPAPTPTPSVTWSGVLSAFTVRTNGVNATGALDTPTGADRSNRTDFSNLLASVQRTGGIFRFGATVGAYSFPVVGQALNPTFQPGSNANTYGLLPIAYVQFVPSDRFGVFLGKLPTLLGQENAFTFQNADVQRGLGWNAENVVSRGIRAQYTSGKATAVVGYNDGFYSGNHGAIEGSFAWNASPAASLAFAFLLPESDTPPNRTAAIANKREYDLMYTGQYGKLSVTPYVLWVRSPLFQKAGFTRSENALFACLIGSYAFDARWSLGARYESAFNSSATSDASANADLVGYGPGSGATTYTVTPAYRAGKLTARAEWSFVNTSDAAAGLGFGAAGRGSSQTRFAMELGVQF